MVGLVEEIQQLALDPSVKVSDLLRRVKLAAVKLGLDTAVEWVDKELRGYDTFETPNYREAVGQLKAHTPFHGVVPVTGENEFIQKLCSRPICSSVPAIESLLDGDGDTLIHKAPNKLASILNKSNKSPGTEYFIHMPVILFKNVLEQVRNAVLDWAIDLEKAGIRGEDFSFSIDEKKAATQAATTISIGNFTGHLHQGDVSGDQNRTSVGSVDNSRNTNHQDRLFLELREAIQNQVVDQAYRT